MKKIKLITFVLLLTFSFKLDAQTNLVLVGKVVSDKESCKSDIGRIENGLIPILKSNNAIEIRFIEGRNLDHINYTVLTFNKKWKAMYYKFDKEKDSLLGTEIALETNLDTLFSKLVKNNIFSLPNQEEIKVEKAYFNTDNQIFEQSGCGVGDGSLYWVEFKIGNRYRRYSFGSPKFFADFYPYISELKNYENIMNIFYSLNKSLN